MADTLAPVPVEPVIAEKKVEIQNIDAWSSLTATDDDQTRISGSGDTEDKTWSTFQNRTIQRKQKEEQLKREREIKDRERKKEMEEEQQRKRRLAEEAEISSQKEREKARQAAKLAREKVAQNINMTEQSMIMSFEHQQANSVQTPSILQMFQLKSIDRSKGEEGEIVDSKISQDIPLT